MKDARRSPTISGHATMTSDVAKPCAAREGPRQASTKSERWLSLGLRFNISQSKNPLESPLDYPDGLAIASTMLTPADSVAKPHPRDLLAWYDRHRRVLPWRAKPGETADPYRVWLSEIMLQQTTVTAVKPFYLRFVERFPTVEVLAEAPADAVMQAWAGLGYYSRARNLHACAKVVVEKHGGHFPATEAELLDLPGIGAYTAAAVAAIAFGAPAAAVDGNVERVMSRRLQGGGAAAEGEARDPEPRRGPRSARPAGRFRAGA